jgi:hypothetical protein
MKEWKYQCHAIEPKKFTRCVHRVVIYQHLKTKTSMSSSTASSIRPHEIPSESEASLLARKREASISAISSKQLISLNLCFTPAGLSCGKEVEVLKNRNAILHI